jgi:hypothetical protein
MQNSNYTIGNRTLELPTCNAVPQPTALPRAPIRMYYYVYTAVDICHVFMLTGCLQDRNGTYGHILIAVYTE